MNRTSLPADTLPYNLYLNVLPAVLNTNVWGDGSGGRPCGRAGSHSIAGTANVTLDTQRLVGAIPAGLFPSAGTYQDTVVATVTDPLGNHADQGSGVRSRAADRRCSAFRVSVPLSRREPSRADERQATASWPSDVAFSDRPRDCHVIELAQHILQLCQRLDVALGRLGRQRNRHHVQRVAQPLGEDAHAVTAFR